MGALVFPAAQTDKLELLSASLNQPVVLAYGRHIVGGNVVFLRENSDGTVVVLLALGEGEWDGVDNFWVNGLALDLADTSIVHFHPGLEGEIGAETSPGTRNQKICSFFPLDFVPRLTFARTAYLALKLRRDPTQPGPEFDLRGIFRTLRVRIFDNAGNQTSYAYSFNPAWCCLDLLLRGFLLPRGLINEGLPQAVKDRIDFQAFKDWADFCDADLTINGQSVNRFELHAAFVDETDLLRGLEWILLQGRAYMLERNGKFAPFADQSRSSQLTVGLDNIAEGSLRLGQRSLRDVPNRYLGRFRALDSGTVANDPRQDFQPQLKEVADEDHQEQVGRTITAEIELGNSTAERAERLLEYSKRRNLGLDKTVGFHLLPTVAGSNDLLPGDVLTAPAELDAATSKEYEIFEISEDVEGGREVVALEYDPSVFVDTAGPQQQVKTVPDPGGGIAPNPQMMPNVLLNGGFFRGGVSGQEGTTRPKFFQGYSNTGAGPPAWTTDLEHDLNNDRVKVKTKTSTVDKIGMRTLWRNLGKAFKPGQLITIAVTIRHSGASGTYNKDVKLKLDSNAQDYGPAAGGKFQMTITAGQIPNTVIEFWGTFQLRTDAAVPDKLNVFLWSEATNASKSNEDLEVDSITMASGRVRRAYVPGDEVRDADIVWNATDSLYDLPDYFVKGGTASSDSGGAGAAAGGGIGSAGDDFEEGRTRPGVI